MHLTHKLDRCELVYAADVLISKNSFLGYVRLCFNISESSCFFPFSLGRVNKCPFHNVIDELRANLFITKYRSCKIPIISKKTAIYLYIARTLWNSDGKQRIEEKMCRKYFWCIYITSKTKKCSTQETKNKKNTHTHYSSTEIVFNNNEY